MSTKIAKISKFVTIEIIGLCDTNFQEIETQIKVLLSQININDVYVSGPEIGINSEPSEVDEKTRFLTESLDNFYVKYRVRTTKPINHEKYNFNINDLNI